MHMNLRHLPLACTARGIDGALAPSTLSVLSLRKCYKVNDGVLRAYHAHLHKMGIEDHEHC